ncbi:MAG: HypC/HybG/HupF family hydrogenase formation chaperone [Phycisphaerae bacterium]
MCLAYPGKVIEINGCEGRVELVGNQYNVNLVLVPEVAIGQYVLVHAGYAIQIVDEEVARETWEIFNQIDEKLA